MSKLILVTLLCFFHSLDCFCQERNKHYKGYFLSFKYEARIGCMREEAEFLLFLKTSNLDSAMLISNSNDKLIKLLNTDSLRIFYSAGNNESPYEDRFRNDTNNYLNPKRIQIALSGIKSYLETDSNVVYKRSEVYDANHLKTEIRLTKMDLKIKKGFTHMESVRYNSSHIKFALFKGIIFHDKENKNKNRDLCYFPIGFKKN